MNRNLTVKTVPFYTMIWYRFTVIDKHRVVDISFLPFFLQVFGALKTYSE